MRILWFVVVHAYGEVHLCLTTQRIVVLVDDLENSVVGLTLLHINSERAGGYVLLVVKVVECNGLAGAYAHVETLTSTQSRLLPSQGSSLLVSSHFSLQVRNLLLSQFERDSLQQRTQRC